jgi:hypothetical protein
MTGRRNLSPSMMRLLREGECACHRGGKRHCCARCEGACRRDSAVSWSLMVAMINAGWTEEDAWTQLINQQHAGGAHFQRMAVGNLTRARVTHRTEFVKAARWVAANPVSDVHENTAKLIDVRNVMTDCRHLFSRGRAGVTEVAVLRRLIEIGIQNSSMVVSRSVRQLAVDVDIREGTVCAALQRLKMAGIFLRHYRNAHGGRSAAHVLVVPPSKTRSTTVTGGLVPPSPEESHVTVVGGRVHRLFGALGLPLGALDTLARIPQREVARRVPDLGGSPVRGGHRVEAPVARVSAGKKSRDPRPAHAAPTTSSTTSPRGLPAAPVRPPPTAAEIARERGMRSTSTVVRHLRRMERYGMLQQNADGTWERLPFDADALADELGIPHTAELKAQKYEVERRAWRAQRIEWAERDVQRGRLKKSVAGGKLIYADAKTGVVQEVFSDDQVYGHLAERGAM